MDILPDYSEFLKRPGMLNYIEQEWLARPEGHDLHAKVVNDLIQEMNLKSVLELGCGTGNVAKRLVDCKYLGIDANPECIDLARKKNPELAFMVWDIRTFNPQPPADLTICYGVLKHFGLHEWEQIFAHIASTGSYFIFDLPISNVAFDDGADHHHVWMTRERMDVYFQHNNLQLITTRVMNKDELAFVTTHKV